MTSWINKKIIGGALLLFFICLFAYSNALNHDFLLDDHRYLLGPENVATFSWPDLLTKPHHGHFRPVGRIFLKLSVTAMGNNAFGYHLIHFVLFYGVCLLLFLNVWKLFDNFELALLTGCLFAAHPINNMLVNYKTSIGFCANLVFLYTSVWCLLHYLNGKKLAYFIFSLILYLLSLLCHEISFMLPVFLLIILHAKGTFSFKKNIFVCFTYSIPLMIYFLLRLPVMGTSARDTYQGEDLLSLSLTLNQYVVSLGRVAAWYISKLFYPVNILLMWDEPLPKDVFVLWPYAAFIILVVLFVIAFIKMRHNPYAFGLCFFLPGFLPLILASFTYTTKTNTVIIEPHWMVFASLGFFIIPATLLLSIKKWSNRFLFMGIAIVIVFTLCVLTRKSNAVWKDPLTYCTFWMEHNKLNATAFSCRAKEDLRSRDKGFDLQQYKSCEEIAFLGGSYNVLQQRDRALKYYELALEKDANCPIAYLGLGILHMDVKEYKKAERNLRKAIYIDQYFGPAYLRLIELYEIQGRTKEANQIKELLGK